MDVTRNYSKTYSPSARVVRVGLAETPIDCLLDTGFSGGVLIPFSIFESLGFNRLVADEYRVVMPDSRRFPLYTTQEEVNIGELKIMTEVHSSPLVAKKILGRRPLRSLVARLDGPKELLSIPEHTQDG